MMNSRIRMEKSKVIECEPWFVWNCLGLSSLAVGLVLFLGLCGLLTAGELNYESLYQYSDIGADLHVEQMASPNNGDSYILFRVTNRTDRSVEYRLLRLDEKGQEKSLIISELKSLNTIALSNIFFTPQGEVGLIVTSGNSVYIYSFPESLDSYEISKLDYEGQIKAAYYYDRQLYVFVSKLGDINLYSYDFTKKQKPPKMGEPIEIQSALGIDDIYFSDNSLYFLGDHLGKKGITKSVWGLVEGRVSHFNFGKVDGKYLRFVGNSGDDKLFVLLVDGSLKRIFDYRIEVINFPEKKILKTYSGVGSLRWIEPMLIDGKVLVAFEIKKHNKRYTLNCRNISESINNTLILDMSKFKKHYREVSAKQVGSSLMLAVVYAEVRGRVTYDVISIVKIPHLRACG